MINVSRNILFLGVFLGMMSDRVQASDELIKAAKIVGFSVGVLALYSASIRTAVHSASIRTAVQPSRNASFHCIYPSRFPSFSDYTEACREGVYLGGSAGIVMAVAAAGSHLSASEVCKPFGIMLSSSFGVSIAAGVLKSYCAYNKENLGRTKAHGDFESGVSSVVPLGFVGAVAVTTLYTAYQRYTHR